MSAPSLALVVGCAVVGLLSIVAVHYLAWRAASWCVRSLARYLRERTARRVLADRMADAASRYSADESARRARLDVLYERRIKPAIEREAREKARDEQRSVEELREALRVQRANEKREAEMALCWGRGNGVAGDCGYQATERGGLCAMHHTEGPDYAPYVSGMFAPEWVSSLTADCTAGSVNLTVTSDDPYGGLYLTGEQVDRLTNKPAARVHRLGWTLVGVQGCLCAVEPEGSNYNEPTRPLAVEVYQPEAKRWVSAHYTLADAARQVLRDANS